MANEIQAVRSETFVAFDDPEWRYWRGEDGWYLSIPGCGLAGLRNHEVVEHEDRTISVTPSILVHGHDAAGQPVKRHGFLTRGVWHGCDDDVDPAVAAEILRRHQP